MIVSQRDGGIFVSDIGNFNPAETLDCGQAFRWTLRDDGLFFGVASNKKLLLQEIAGGFLFHGIDLDEFNDFWFHYFDFGTDYSEILNRLSGDSTLKMAIKKFSGIRILRQNSAEATFSFIISQNNNIPRIKKIVEKLSSLCGTPLGENLFAFPTPEQIASRNEEELCRELRCGYRGEYLISTARALCDGKIDFDEIASLPLKEAEKKLCELKGVGPKVAQCILLYGLHRTDAFPVDVWVKRIMERFYPHGFPHLFNDVAGIAQQYLFHYIRNES